jgi:hypothetical protein
MHLWFFAAAHRRVMPPISISFTASSGYVVQITELRVLADAAMAVVRGLVSWETVVDGAFAIQT